MTMDPSFVGLLRCPGCHAERLVRSRSRIDCDACSRTFTLGHGYWGMLDGQAEPEAASRTQRLMESALVARLYDRVWRPTFVRIFGGPRGAAGVLGANGELFVHKQSLVLEDRDGPWLDLSCSTGMFTRAMASAAPGDCVVGLDISGAMLEVAHTRLEGYSNAVLVRADAHELPFRDGVFGGVNHAGALHAYDDPFQVFREIWRVLRPGGVYVASTFAQVRGVRGVVARLAGIRRFSQHDLRGQLSGIGFANYEEARLGDSVVFRVRKPS